MGVQEDLDALAGREPGDLIQAAHWNALVAAVKLVEQALRGDLGDLASATATRFAEVTGRLDEVGDRIDGVDDRVGAVQADVEALKAGLRDARDSLAALRGRFRRVTMRTGRASYAVGELAEITARVTDLDGGALDLSNAAARPWVDFVTVWGQLKAAPGFATAGGAGDRTVSVRVNAQGEARVLLKAEQVLELAEDVELQMASFLTTKVGAQEKTVSAVLLEANTPADEGVKEAFRAVSAEYDRPGAGGVRQYADRYYLGGNVRLSGAVPPVSVQTWRDVRSTVVALVKGDNDPVTAEASLGSCSLQVAFRDWLGPWIVGTYFPDFEVHVPAYQDKFQARVAGDYRESVEGLKNEVSEILRDKGVLGRERDYRAMDEALDRLHRPDPPPYFAVLTRQVQGAIRVQQAVDRAGGSGRGEDAFVALAEAQARADLAASAAREDLGGLVDRRMGEFEVQIKSHVQQTQQVFRDDLLAESGPIKAVERQVGAMSGTVAALKALNVEDVASGITVIRGMDNRLKAIELTR